MTSKKKPSWKDIKSILVDKDKTELLKLIADLYAYRSDNKKFIHSRYMPDKQTLESYKDIITDSLYPDFNYNSSISLSAGRKAISDYYKATKDKSGQLELMVHYLETGNSFTVDCGDVDEQFYASLESMFEKILSALRKEAPRALKKYLPRLESVVTSSEDIGWGYHDYIYDIFYEFVEDINDT